MNAEPPAAELEALLRLLDDETPEVRTRVVARFGECDGDLSEWLATRPTALSKKESALLAEMLRPPRRTALEREWIAPTGGAAALTEDWETFEALLRALSDFLHDGISLRQPLSDALDLMAEEAVENGVSTANELREFLFLGKRLAGNREGYYDPRNSDLAWCLAEGVSNPLGLCLIFLLAARRLDLEAEGVNFPGHFMCRIFEDGMPLIVDCFDHGHLHLQNALMENPEINREQRAILRSAADPGNMLLRLLGNLGKALHDAGRVEDAELVAKLAGTLG